MSALKAPTEIFEGPEIRIVPRIVTVREGFGKNRSVFVLKKERTSMEEIKESLK